MKSFALLGNYGLVSRLIVSRLRSPANAWLAAKAAENRTYSHFRRRLLCGAQDLGAVAGVYAVSMDAAKPGRVGPRADMMHFQSRLGGRDTLPPNAVLEVIQTGVAQT